MSQINENVLRDVTTEWQTEMGDKQVTCHSRMVGGVLCRWWGDGPVPLGVALIDAVSPPPRDDEP